MDQKPEEETGSPANAALQGALAALKRGDKVTAQRLAQQAAGLAPDSEAPWLVLAALSGPEESVDYASKALQVNPHSERAQKALRWAQSRLPAQPPAEKPSAEEPPAEKGLEPPAETGPGESPIVSQEETAETPHTVIAEAPEGAAAQAAQEGVPAASEELPGQPHPEFAPAIPPAAGQPPASTGQVSQPAGPRQRPVPAGQKKAAPARLAWWVIVLAILVIVALAAAGIIFLPRLLAGLSPQAGCSPSLELGGRSLTVEKINPGSSATLPAPASAAGRAYWVEGTSNNAVFMLSPAPENLALVNGLKTGDTALFTQANCNKTGYSLSTFTPSEPVKSALLDQSTAQITLYIPSSASFTGLVIQGPLTGENILSLNTPDASSLQVEISLLGTTTSDDKTTISVTVYINNTGQTTARLTSGDVSLAPEGAAPEAPIRVEPPLPLDIKPGAAESLRLTFRRPSTPTAGLKIFTVEYTLENY